MAERSHLSIGEVLSLLREEFPDVTISKIRFLESQGLVDPERTPSGYRKFYDQDVERLRWILRQQREHFLPLKVIRGRLSENPEDPTDNANTAEPAAGAAEAPPVSQAGNRDLRRSAATSRRSATPTLPGLGSEAPDTGDGPETAEGRAPEAPATATGPAKTGPVETGPAKTGPAERGPAETGPVERGPAKTGPAETGRAKTGPVGTGAAGSSGLESDSFSAEELALAAGTTPGLVSELKQYGLISVHATVAGTAYFDQSSLAVTKAAAGFALHGIEARHLRAWRNSADREAALFEQLVMPLLRQRNPQARRQAAETVSNLSRLGGELREALLERALREIR